MQPGDAPPVKASPTFPGMNAGTTQITAHPPNLGNHSSDNRRLQEGLLSLSPAVPLQSQPIFDESAPKSRPKHALERTLRTYL